ncbi:GNAT family N-acetyltransferase [Fusibacter ferrireducens]|uniref:GNAT family N-acetyltransferase n=1 Tax=Fusibacter ferrireducens TaxID=2785058 RepID=A0ABR9ZZ76_9FIRM|nr:GNAT family N-acetyltransferase [Fusibacter ferrireducens]MBF4694894.1 GNAT family N-acetyltransferase [Fusibacter ferrireducens]
MNFRRVEDYKQLFEDQEVKALLKTCIFNATDGKAQNVAQSIYAKTQGRFYVLGCDDTLYGIIGGSVIDNDLLIIKHIAVRADQRGKGYGKMMLKELTHLGDFMTLKVECDHHLVDFFKACNFKCHFVKSDDFTSDQYECLLKC